MSTLVLRQNFIDFFRKNGHKFLSPSKVYNDDPSLLFVNAGMNQLKSVFLGQTVPSENFTQLCNSQICIRAGGKHNDLADVGFDSTHLTSFEMLGSWSLSSYKKDVAIDLAFRYLTEECKLNPEQMYVTYFEGTDDIPADLETKDLWKNYLPESRIVAGNFKDNFWMMGNSGPCGGCTEIHYDMIGGRSVPELVNHDDPHVIEIWNVVFMEYNLDEKSGEYHKLDNFYVDTGMGLERLSAILQGKRTVYQTDAFRYLIGYAQALTGGEYYPDVYDGSHTNSAYRIFADHIRTVVVALFDGVQFGCNNKEFVLRKIFRRLLTHMYIYINNKVVEQKFTHPIIRSMISDIMCYFLKKKHNPDDIWTKLIKEEKLFINKMRHIGRKFKNRSKCTDDIEKVHKQMHDIDGVPMEFLKNINSIKFV